MTKAFLSIKNRIFRQCLQRVLEDEGKVEIVGHCGEIDKAEFGDVIPQLLIIEFLSNSTDLITIEKISKQYHDLKILVIAHILEAKDYSGLINAGVNGCVDSSKDLNCLFAAISEIMSGKIHFSHEVLNQVMTNSMDVGKNTNNLTFREIEVLRLLCDGLTNEQISEKLHLSYDTVKWHRNNILIKCGCKNVLALYKYAIRTKLIEATKVS